MAFHETRFPTGISYGATGGPGFNTAVTRIAASGAEERIARWATPIHRFNVSHGVKSWSDLADLRTFYMARHGIANGFRYFDWADHTSQADGVSEPGAAPGDQQIGIGDGTAKNFQLSKTYVEGGVSRVRIIEKPINGEVIAGAGRGDPDPTYNVRIFLNGVEAVSGWTIDTATGIVQFSPAPAAGVVITASFAFDVPVRFGRELDELLPINLEAFDVGGLDDITLVEVPGEAIVNEDVDYGGAQNLGVISGDNVVSTLNGRMVTFADNTGGANILVPDAAEMPLGGPIFFFFNEGSATASLREEDLTLIGNLAPNTLYFVTVGLDIIGAQRWYLG